MKTQDADQIAEAIVKKASNMDQGAGSAMKSAQLTPVTNLTVEKIKNGYLVKSHDYHGGLGGGFDTYFIEDLASLPEIANKIFK